MLPNKLEKINTIVCAVWFFLLPLFIIPGVFPLIDFGKRIFGLFFLVVFSVLWGIVLLVKQKLQLRINLLFLALAGLSVAQIISSLVAPNKLESLWQSSQIIASGLIFFLIINTITKEENRKIILAAILSSGVLVSFLAIIQRVASFPATVSPVSTAPTGIMSIILNPQFSLLGSLTSQAIFILALIPLALWLFLKNTSSLQKTSALVSLVILTFGFILTAKVLFESPPLLIDWTTNWKVSINSLGTTTKEAILGTGPGNFSISFNLFRPATYNASPNWNINFQTGRSELLNILTTGGLLSFAALVFILIRLIYLMSRTKSVLSFTILVFFVSLIFFPFFPFLWYFFIPLFAVITPFYQVHEEKIAVIAESENAHEFNTTADKIIPVSFFVIILVSSGILLFSLYRLALAEYYMNSSLSYSDAVPIFNLQQKAVSLNPISEAYHIAFSRTNLAIANVLSQKKNITDQDKQLAGNHLQFAINEAGVALSLNPYKRENQEYLADLYQLLSGSNQNAAQMALSNYTNSINLAPTSPDLYLKRGGVFISQKDLESALRDFQTSAALKPDFPNAHFNLSYVFEQKKEFGKAIDELKTTLSLIPANSPDYKSIKAKLDQLTKLNIATPSNTPALVPSEPIPTPAPKKPTVSPSATPSASSTSPSPVPTNTP